jgi:hypothetical protein
MGQIIEHLKKKNSRPEPAAQLIETSLESPRPNDYGISYGLISLKALPQPDWLEFNLQKDQICLITDDGTDATKRLVERLSKEDWKIVVMQYPQEIIKNQSKFPNNVSRVVLHDMSEDHLQTRLKEMSSSEGKIAVYIHLTPPESNLNTTDEEDTADFRKALLKHTFLMAKHLKTPLNEAAKNGRGVFMTVTHLDGEFGLGQDAEYQPVEGGLAGLVKTLNLEWQAVFCRAVDLNPTLEPEQMTDYIIAELFDPNRLMTEVGYTIKGRQTLVVNPVE